MKPIEFKEANTNFGVGQESVEPMPALYLGEHGEVISCWKMTFKEALRLLFTRKIWLCIVTFGKPLQPSFMGTRKKELFVPKKDNNNK